jgi:hypothetical protein
VLDSVAEVFNGRSSLDLEIPTPRPMPTSRFRIPWVTGQHPKSSKDNTYKFAFTKGKGVMTLADIVGATAAAQIENTGELQFRTTGDTGRGPHTAQQDVAEAMARHIDPTDTTRAAPSFFMWAM